MFAISEIYKAESFKDQIYKMIKEKILNREYVDNDILNERKLSEELKVSRTPVREALKALESEDWVEYIPYKGVIVKQLGQQELTEVFQMRKALESLMIELAIPYIGGDEINKLQSCLDKQFEVARSGIADYDTFLGLDTEFHDILIHANPNKMLQKTLANLREKIRRQGLQSLYSSTDRFAITVNEHMNVLNAVKARDISKAKTAMEVHIEKSYKTAAAYIHTFE